MFIRLLLAAVVLSLLPLFLSAGTIAGKASFTGTPAKQKPIDMSMEPTCVQQHASPVTAESVVTGPNNSLANVVVYVSSGAPDEGQAPTQAVTFDQKGCQYVPHVVVLRTGQELKILNSDQTSHNVHPLAKTNREWNRSLPPGAPPLSERYEKEEIIPVKCNVHPWMRGYFVVLKTSHYDVSKSDGAFKLPSLPAGKYTLTAWHETYGTQTADVVITGDEKKEVNFVFKAKTY